MWRDPALTFARALPTSSSRIDVAAGREVLEQAARVRRATALGILDRREEIRMKFAGADTEGAERLRERLSSGGDVATGSAGGLASPIVIAIAIGIISAAGCIGSERATIVFKNLGDRIFDDLIRISIGIGLGRVQRAANGRFDFLEQPAMTVMMTARATSRRTGVIAG